MANMSYCRFQNTLTDLRDCYDHMDNEDDLSPEEQKARNDILELAAELIEDYGLEIGFYLEEA